MKSKLAFSLSLLIVVFFLNSCYKEPIDYSKDINDLKALVTALQQRSDSLATALGNTNTNLSNLSKSVDSIKLKLTDIQTQIDALTLSLTTANANIAAINAQLVLLNQQYASLLAQLNAILTQLSGTVPFSLNSGLILFYPFNGNADDSSGNGNNGSVFNVTSTIDRLGRSDAAFKFNGFENSSSSQVNCTKTVFNIGQAEYSINMFFKPDNLTQVTRCLFNTIPHTGIGVAFNDNNAPGYLVYDIGPGNAFWDNLYFHGSKNNFVVGEWYSFTLVKNKDVYSFYINGILEHTYTNPQSLNYNYDVGFRISGISDPSIGFQNFAGDLDDVRIYSRALAQSEITYLSTH